MNFLSIVNEVSSGRFWPTGAPVGCTGIAFSVEGTDTATHIGRFPIVKTLCLDPATGATSGDDVLLTAANGDEIYMTFTGSLESVNGTTFQFDEDFELVGGTGRFARAEGHLDITLVVNMADGTWSSSGSGWMSYHASDRAGR